MKVFLEMRKNKSLVVFACAVMLCFRAGELYASDVEVSGIILDEKKGNVALINGSVVTKGDMVKGARVVDITKQGVLFNRDGEEYFLQLKVPASGSTNLNKTPNPFFSKKKQSSSDKNSSMASKLSTSIKEFEAYADGSSRQVMIDKVNNLKAVVEARNKAVEEQLKEISGQ